MHEILPQVYECELCELRFDKSERLKKHMVSHDAAAPLNCDQCKFVAQDVSNLVEHIRLKHNTLSCDYCVYIATDREDLQTHNF